MAKKTDRDRILDLMLTEPTVRALTRNYELELDSWETCMEALVLILAQQKASLTQRVADLEEREALNKHFKTS